jgi:hypothetical protein
VCVAYVLVETSLGEVQQTATAVSTVILTIMTPYTQTKAEVKDHEIEDEDISDDKTHIAIWDTVLNKGNMHLPKRTHVLYLELDDLRLLSYMQGQARYGTGKNM